MGQEDRECAGLTRYVSPAAAHKVVGYRKKRRGWRGHVFRCRDCGSWHVGHNGEI